MQHVEVTRRFEAPIARVWERYTDHRGWSDWAGIGRVTLDRSGTSTPNGVGCVRKITTAGISVHEEIVDFQPERRMVYTLIRGPVPIRNHRGEVLFEPDDGGTRVTWRCRFDSMIPGLGGFMRRGITRMFSDVLARLESRAGL